MILTEVLTWLHLMTTRHCVINEPDRFEECYEYITDCVMDGERFNWCVKDREEKRGCWLVKGDKKNEI